MTENSSDKWRELYRFAVSSYFLDPSTKQIFPGYDFDEEYCCETSMSTGGAFMSKKDFDASIGPVLNAESKITVLEIPTFLGMTSISDASICVDCDGWEKFDSIQTEQLLEHKLVIGIAMFDQTRSWVLIKDPDIIYLFARKRDRHK